MGGSSGTAVVVAARTGPVWQTCGERWSTWLVFFRASAMVRVLRWVTARFRIFSQRTTAHGPHKTASSAGRSVHSPAADRTVATPSAIEMSPAVNTAMYLYGTPASWDSTSRARSRRPNIPWVQPCEGSPRSAASTASPSSCVGWKGSPVGRPSAARTATDSPGRSSPVVVWWWSMAAPRHRCVPAAAGTQRCRVAAIDHHHTTTGLDRPGGAVAVRAAPGRPTGEPIQPTQEEGEAVEAALRGLPSHGWTQGMFGRRERALLVLSQLAGVPYNYIAVLTAGA